MINHASLVESFSSYKNANPFDHCVIDNFLLDDVADAVVQEFPSYDNKKWFCYKNAVEDKKVLVDWAEFPKATYSLFQYLNSPGFVDHLGKLAGIKLYADSGLHGGGWHCHGTGGNLNPHLDYSIHPKLGLQRKLNIIIYVSKELTDDHGGYLGFWEHDEQTNRPKELIKEIEPRHNRAVVFDTTQNSWHGLSRALTQPEGIYRKSLAIYYLCDPPANTDSRGRALFAPRDDQKNNAEIEELIRLRSDVEKSKLVYIGNK
jgi:hypothetical protein